MLSRIFLSALFLGSAVAADNLAREITYTLADGCPQGGCRVPGFDKGYLFQLKNSGTAPPDGLAVFDPKGMLAYQIDITAPDGSPGHLRPRAETDAADTDGTVLLPIFYGGYGGNGHVKGGGIVVLDPYGKEIRFVDTARFLPDAACFGPDHSIWVMGTQFAPLRDGDSIDHVEPGDYNLVRKYSLDGKQIGAFVARSSFPAGLPPASAGWMRASGSRVGVMTYSGPAANNPEWIELDLDGKLMGRWKLGPRSKGDPDTHNTIYSLQSFAFTLDGRLFAETMTCAALHRCSYQLVSLDRNTTTWKATDGSPVNSSLHLLAADGNDLILQDRSWSSPGGIHVLRVQLNPPR
jgi:hypothetical protein